MNQKIASEDASPDISPKSDIPPMFANAAVGNSPWKCWLLFLFVGVFAFGFRYYYVIHAEVQQPRGDAIEYYAYARNLAQYNVFSKAPEGASQHVGDSFRDPGYPLFLAGWMKAFGQWDSWYASVLLSQTLLSALTVLLVMGFARRWVPMRWLAAAGMLMALWPHNVTMSGYLLSETLYGFLCALGLFLFGIALDRRSPGWAAASGVGLSLAALTNAVMLPFATLLALYMLARRQLSVAMFAGLVVAALIITVPWSVRNAMLPASGSSSAGRALMNLVLGSWPDMHYAYQAKANGDPIASALMAPINQEIVVIQADPMAGLARIGQRMASHPGEYVRWYLSKPALLWGWSIRVGQGDIYVFPTRHSPFETNVAYRIVAALCRALNPWIFVLAIIGCLLALLPRQRNRPSVAAAALLLIFVTAVYTLLQAEPRYSVPFRGLEIMLAVFAVYRGSRFIQTKRAARLKPAVL
jgi:4-amino-4-deoxy-L-arabinose transferase-like glycosyltransferase